MLTASLGDIIAGAVILIAGALLCTAFYNAYLHPLSRVPGPRTGRVFPLWTTSSIFRRRLNPDLARLHETYGPVVRVGPNQLSFTTISAQKSIYHNTTHSSSEHFRKDGTLQDIILTSVLDAPNVGTLTDPVRHRQLRNRLLPGFTMKAVLAQESVMRLHVDRMIERIEKDPGLMDLSQHLVRFAWDMIGDLAFGEPLVPEKCDTLRTLLKVYENCSPALEVINYVLPQSRAAIGLMCRLIPFVNLRAVLPTARLRSCIDRQDGRSDFLTHIMRDNNDSKTELSLSYQELHSNATILMLAGYKTTESSLSALFHHLLSNPGAFQTLQRELHHRFKGIKEITGKELLALPFLNGCVHETLRLTPPLAGKIASRTSPGATLEDLYVPAGTEVFSETYTMQRSPQYWHAPNDFRPERWYKREAGDVYEHDNHAAYKPFSSGARVCLGKELALQSLRLSAALLVYRFDFTMPARGHFVWDADVTSRMTYTGYRVLAEVYEHSPKELYGGAHL